jgi:hypothetical protein
LLSTADPIKYGGVKTARAWGGNAAGAGERRLAPVGIFLEGEIS